MASKVSGWVDADTGRAFVFDIGVPGSFFRDGAGDWSAGFVMPQDLFDNFAEVSDTDALMLFQQALAAVEPLPPEPSGPLSSPERRAWTLKYGEIQADREAQAFVDNLNRTVKAGGRDGIA